MTSIGYAAWMDGTGVSALTRHTIHVQVLWTHSEIYHHPAKGDAADEYKPIGNWSGVAQAGVVQVTHDDSEL